MNLFTVAACNARLALGSRIMSDEEQIAFALRTVAYAVENTPGYVARFGGDDAEALRAIAARVEPSDGGAWEASDLATPDEHPDYPVDDWRYEVGNGDTKLGYAEWLAHKKEANAACPHCGSEDLQDTPDGTHCAECGVLVDEYQAGKTVCRIANCDICAPRVTP